jgi:hypothetical protein
MVDSGIKKATVKYTELPNISVDEDGPFYSLRYRVISEDKNRVSHWSEITRIDFPSTSLAGMPYTSIDRIHLNLIGSSHPRTIAISWDYPQEDEYNVDPEIAKYEEIFSQNQSFDIILRWNENNAPDDINWTTWQFAGTIRNNSFSILKPNPLPAPYSYNPKQIQASIQIPSTTKNYNEDLSLFKITHNI